MYHVFREYSGRICLARRHSLFLDHQSMVPHRDEKNALRSEYPSGRQVSLTGPARLSKTDGTLCQQRLFSSHPICIIRPISRAHVAIVVAMSSRHAEYYCRMHGWDTSPWGYKIQSGNQERKRQRDVVPIFAIPCSVHTEY